MTAKRNKHKWIIVVPAIERVRSNPNAPVYRCVHCAETVDLRDAILDGGWREAKQGECPGRPKWAKENLAFHMINVVAPHA